MLQKLISVLIPPSSFSPTVEVDKSLTRFNNISVPHLVVSEENRFMVFSVFDISISQDKSNA